MRRRRIVRQVQPQLPVTDLPRAMAFHRRLGFDVEAYEGGGHAFVMDSDTELWHLREVDDLAGGTNQAALYAHVRDPDALRARLADEGLDPSPVVSEPWGMREFSLTDPDGNLLRFGTNT
ncbi:MAG TPA: VOC family protein [Nitriliruptoraceae bacterium]|nr:VOC family protein [Nitriliruptoraceae bacterium]